jgi:RNA polymerase sigma-70 factor (ECF subfamily)
MAPRGRPALMRTLPNQQLWMTERPPALAPASVPAGARPQIGSALSFDDVYRQHAADVLRWAIRLLGRTGDPDDVLHEVFLVVQRKLGEFRGDAKLGTWLYEITVRIVQRQRRSDRRWTWLRSPEGGGQGGWLDGFGAAAGDTLDPHTFLERRRDTELLYRLLDRIGEKYRTVVILADLEGLSAEQIAVIVGITPTNVSVRLKRGRDKLLARYRALQDAQPAAWTTRNASGGKR